MTENRNQGRTISIALVVSLALTAVVTLVLAAFAFFFYQAEREQRWAQLHKSVAASADELAVAVALPTWNFDESQILAIMRSGLNNHELYASVVAPTSSRRQYVLVRDSGRLVADAALPQVPGMLAEQRAIVVAGQNIGSVTMYAAPDMLLAQLHQRLLAIVGMILVLDITLVASLYLLLWLLMLKPLKAVGDYAATVKAGQSVAATPHKAWFFGELKSLNEAIREMIGLLDRRYQAMHRSEERLQMATSAASIGIWDWDLVNNELNWDEQMFRLYRSDKHSAAPRLDIWFAAVLEEDREPAAQALAAARRGESEFDIEFRIVWPGGSLRYIKADAITFRDAAGLPVRMVGTNYDITEHKEAELELRRHRNHLEELVEERTKALSVAVRQAEAANRAKS
ncbi:MAG TPA: PAS domain-containing protein, partial [Janthinobacterium sp.]|nr:PAS domain-containing protein [Janthinobacterium sp.]